MNDISTKLQVWLLRHGKTPFVYENSNYDDFIQMLCNPHSTPLDKEPGIDFKSLPKRADFVGYSQFTRAFETAKLLRNELYVKQIREMPILDEVRFDKNIIRRHEYRSLASNRKDILKRWYSGRNEAETFEDSLARVKEIESFLSERQEKTIILVTHGWFLRLLEIYFVQGKRAITIDDLLKVKPVPLGHCIKATVERKNRIETPMDLVGGDILSNPPAA